MRQKARMARTTEIRAMVQCSIASEHAKSAALTAPLGPSAACTIAPERRFSQAFQSDLGGQASGPKIYYFFFSENHGLLSPSRLDYEGRFAIVTNVGCGMRWPFRIAARCSRADEQFWQDVEIVWSWRPDAGAKPAGLDEFSR